MVKSRKSFTWNFRKSYRDILRMVVEDEGNVRLLVEEVTIWIKISREKLHKKLDSVLKK